MSDRCDIFIDLETMGTSENAVILSVGLLAVTAEMHEWSLEQLKEAAVSIKLDAREQVRTGRVVHKNVVDWWEKQSKDARSILKHLPTDVKPQDFLSAFFEALHETKYVPNSTNRIWQRGTIDYDMIAHLVRQYNGEEGIQQLHGELYWGSVRDIRTAIEMVNVINHGSSNKYALPHDDAVKEHTDGKYDSWFSYRDNVLEKELTSHDASSDCVIQFDSMRVAGLF